MHNQGGREGHSAQLRVDSKRPRVLVTGAERPIAHAVVRAVAREDLDIHMVPASSRNSVGTLLGICRAIEADLLVPTVPAELADIARARHQFESQGTRVLLGSARSIALCAETSAEIARARKSTPQRRKPEDPNRRPRRTEEYAVDLLIDRLGMVAAAVPYIADRHRDEDRSGPVWWRRIRDPWVIASATKVADSFDLDFAAHVRLREDAFGLLQLIHIAPGFSETLAMTVASGVNVPLLAIRSALDLDSELDATHAPSFALGRRATLPPRASGFMNKATKKAVEPASVTNGSDSASSKNAG